MHHMPQDENDYSLTVPYSVIEALVVERIRSERISQIEEASATELLGVDT